MPARAHAVATLLRSDFCKCFDDWTGFNCNARVCPFGLGWATRNSLDLFDMSTPNYPSGMHAYEECSGVGACDRSTGICICVAGYTGLGCRRAECPNKCSGNGICVDSAQLVFDYGGDERLQYQKMYWDARKSTQCLCDAGYEGVDCSVRICPQAPSLTADTCNDEATAHHDVQTITVSFADSFAGMSTAQLDQYFTLRYTDGFNSRTTTRPISFWEDAQSVQQALYALPNFAMSEGLLSVTKIWPLQDYTENSDSDNYESHSTLEADGEFRNLACETWYYDAFHDSSCTLDSDCEDKFGLTEATHVACDVNLKVCVETDPACLVDDGIEEFTTAGCADSFTPDGVYFAATLGGKFWGHRLGYFERKCHAGFFEEDDPVYAVLCATSADCVPCSRNTQVTAGECDTATGLCVPSTKFRTTYVTAELEECSTAAFVVSFDTGKGGSKKNTFTCSVGESTNDDGVSPRYESSSLASCSVLHVGLPQWRLADQSSTGLYDLCWSRDAGTGAAANEFVLQDNVAAYETAGGFCYDLDSATASDLNLVVEDQNVLFAKLPEAPRGLTWPSAPLFAASDVANVFEMDYALDLPCSFSGSCLESGLCTCADGFTGVACELKITCGSPRKLTSFVLFFFVLPHFLLLTSSSVQIISDVPGIFSLDGTARRVACNFFSFCRVHTPAAWRWWW